MKEKLMKFILIAAVLILSGILFCCNKEQEKEFLLKEEAQTTEQQEPIGERDTELENGEESVEKPTSICVYVCGAVVNPGVYSLPENSRKYQVIEMAGGMTADAAGQALNLAEVLVDGEKIQVPTIEETETGDFVSETNSQEDSVGGKSGLVNINQADASLLMTLPGIGEGKANAIIAYRQEHSGFSSIEELMQVEGIKQGVFDKLKDKICI